MGLLSTLLPMAAMAIPGLGPVAAAALGAGTGLLASGGRPSGALGGALAGGFGGGTGMLNQALTGAGLGLASGGGLRGGLLGGGLGALAGRGQGASPQPSNLQQMLPSQQFSVAGNVPQINPLQNALGGRGAFSQLGQVNPLLDPRRFGMGRNLIRTL